MTRILVIDDEAPVRTVLRQMLENEGYEVIDAPDGKVGMQRVLEQAPDIIITDILMPDKDGIETILDLRKRLLQIPVIAISGGGRTGKLDFLPAAKAFGAVRTLTKPFERRELLDTVRGVLNQSHPLPPFFRGPTPRCFAHRGASGEAPENTLVAFARAAQSGAPYAEFDVHISRDGQVVVIHDPTVERTTNGQGQVVDLTLAELQQLDAGYRFSLDEGRTFPFRATGIGIPTLAEVLTSFPQVKFTVEIKQTEPSIEAQVIAVIRASGREEDVILASEHNEVMVRARTLAPEMARSFSHVQGVEFMQRVLSGQFDGYEPPGHALQVPPEYNGLRLVTPKTVTMAHALGCEVHVWTINDADVMKRLFDAGVDGIMSDFPERLLAVARTR